MGSFSIILRYRGLSRGGITVGLHRSPTLKALLEVARNGIGGTLTAIVPRADRIALV
ncbi:hypothetical protein [Carnimonas bestiolae]|uniref:hypothetical protein n=1 Tax=Carnimonas bestiolae TaxID=3402172 RepID=UPI003F4A8ADF